MLNLNLQDETTLRDTMRRWNALPMRYGVVVEDARYEAWRILTETCANLFHAIAVVKELADAEFYPTPGEIRNVAISLRAPDAPAAAQWEKPPAPTPEEETELRELIAKVNQNMRERSERFLKKQSNFDAINERIRRLIAEKK